jgi:hypothetical protein
MARAMRQVIQNFVGPEAARDMRNDDFGGHGTAFCRVGFCVLALDFVTPPVPRRLS